MGGLDPNVALHCVSYVLTVGLFLWHLRNKQATSVDDMAALLKRWVDGPGSSGQAK